MLTAAERDILRGLVGRYMEAASLPVQAEKKRLWKALNRSCMERPMVVIDQLPWNELACDALTPQISDPYWRHVEAVLRQTLYKWAHFPVDMVLDPFITIPKALRHTGYGVEIKVERLGDADSTAKSQHFDPVIKTLDDVGKIKDYHITHDEAATRLREEEAAALFGDLAPVRSAGAQIHLGIWDRLEQMIGVEASYLNMIDEPELLHAAMNRLTEATLCAIDDAEALGCYNDIANTCHCSYVYTDELLPDSGEGKGPVPKNSWAYGLAQVFTAVSPAFFEEFELPYITRMAGRFGMIYYGCCDRLDDRLDVVRRIPNVRKVSCSPWSDREKFAEKIGPELIMSNKPTPALLATADFDEDAVREDLKRTCDLAKQNNVNLELILKDISTVKNQPERLTEWADIAMRVVEDF